ncbi:hypothetical protein THII_2779 [Thioploca ingrica]|uniref:Outer membrane efflux protein n=1 Tax=Thioploca ingrica TaxID=40754 RepID=A0A090BVL7_9GAMM|nr:hypothetical protein THII_2779 [Thioploca ingrica]
MKKNSLVVVPASCCLIWLNLSVPVFSSDTPAGGDSGEFTLPEVVKIALQNSPNISLQQLGVEKAKAGTRIASGAFNVNGRIAINSSHSTTKILDVESLHPTDRALLPPSATDIEIQSTNSSLSTGLVKSFRTGVATDLSVTTLQADPDMLSRLGLTTNKTSVKFTVTVPLLKGSGRVSAAAAELAAGLNYEATLADFQYKISATVLDTVTNFWNYVSTRWYLERVQESKQRVQNWIERASASGHNLHGYLEDKKGKLIDTQQALDEAKIALATVIGIPAQQLDSLGKPVADFPLEWKEAVNRFDHQKLQDIWLREAEDKRLDLKATRLRQKIAKVNLDKARKDVLPQLNLSLGTGYNGFSQYNDFDRFTESYYKNVNGMDYSAGLTLSYPFGNDIAGGTLELNQADYQQKALDTDEKIRSIRLDMQNDLSNVYGRMQKAVQVRETILAYRQALEDLLSDSAVLQDETKLLTIMELENKYLEARGDGARALADLASAITKARFNTGTLIVTNETSGEADLANLSTLPGW